MLILEENHENTSVYKNPLMKSLIGKFDVCQMCFHPMDSNHYLTVVHITPENTCYYTSALQDTQALLPSVSHMHDYYELMFVADGACYQLLEKERRFYPRGSFCLLNKNIRHRLEFCTDFRVVFFSFEADMLSQIVSVLSQSYFSLDAPGACQLKSFIYDSSEQVHTKKYMDFFPIDMDADALSKAYDLFDHICHESLFPTRASTNTIFYHLLSLFSLLTDEAAFSWKTNQAVDAGGNDIFFEVQKYLLRKHGRITRTEMETELHYSSNYINQIVKQHTGLSLTQYGMTFRMKRAAYLLSETEENIADIALELGFSNLTQFYKKFEKYYHMTPASYRKQGKEKGKE